MKKAALILLAAMAVTALSGCCRNCRERQQELQTMAGMPEPAPVTYGIYEKPLPYQLKYKSMPSERIHNFAVIEGGQQFVLTPEFPEYFSSKDVVGSAGRSPSTGDYTRRQN
jgi:hypothetical protein